MRWEECKKPERDGKKRWRAYPTEDRVAIYCPKCSLREFSPRFASHSARRS